MIRFLTLAGLIVGCLSITALAQTSTVIPDSEAAQHIGQNATVEGFDARISPKIQRFQWDGHYEAPALNIRYGEGSLRAIPTGISTGSGVLVYFKVKPEHRDFYPREVHILKGTDGYWIEVSKAGDTPPKEYGFNQESFLELLHS
jgi:hypothetical protein